MSHQDARGEGMFRRRRPEAAEMDITPMVDVTVLLLIFTMVGSHVTSGRPVDLPVAEGGVGVATDKAVPIIVRQDDNPVGGAEPRVELENGPDGGGRRIEAIRAGACGRRKEGISDSGRAAGPDGVGAAGGAGGPGDAGDTFFCGDRRVEVRVIRSHGQDGTTKALTTYAENPLTPPRRSSVGGLPNKRNRVFG